MAPLLFRLLAFLGLLMLGASAHQEIRTTIITVAQTPAPIQAMTPTLAQRTDASSVVKVFATHTPTQSPFASASGYVSTPKSDQKDGTPESQVPKLQAPGVSFKDPGFVALTLAFGIISLGMMLH